MKKFDLKDILIVCLLGLSITSIYGWSKCNKEWYKIASEQNDEWTDHFERFIEKLKEEGKKNGKKEK